MKELIEKRTALLAEFDAFKAKLETEKRSAYSNDEMKRINEIKIELSDIKSRVEAEKEIEEQRNFKLDALAPVESKNDNKNIINEFRSFLNGESAEDKFTVPFEEFTKRSTVTTSSNSDFKFVDQAGLSVAESELVLPKLGVKTYYFDAGEVDFPNMSQIVGTFGTEDSEVADQTLTSAKITFAPTFVSASIEVSKKFLKSSKPENIQALMNQLKVGVDKAVEKHTIDSFSSLSPVASGATGVTTSFDNAAIQMEKGLLGSPSGYIFSATGIAKAKLAKTDSGSGIKVYQNGYINSYPAVRSTLQSNANHGYLISADAVAMAYWGAGIEVEVVTDKTLAKKGNVLLIASALADGSYLDANKIAVIKNVDKLS